MIKIIFFLIVGIFQIQNLWAALDAKDFKTWPRAKVDEFGCLLEKSFKSKDPKFNCSLKNYVNKGDPCKNTEGYYEGPVFPQSKAKEVHPLIQSIELSWEHGLLQNLSITLAKKINHAEVKKIFKLSEGHSIQDCGKKNTCIVITGFDHMGAGDVECGQ